jgi:hypothetical protein
LLVLVRVRVLVLVRMLVRVLVRVLSLLLAVFAAAVFAALCLGYRSWSRCAFRPPGQLMQLWQGVWLAIARWGPLS